MFRGCFLGGQEGVVCGIHSRCRRGGREAAAGLILKAWVGLGRLGNRGSREGLCPGYLVFWSAWSVVEQALSVRAGDRDTVDSQEGRLQLVLQHLGLSLPA